jgi:phage shock protein A
MEGITMSGRSGLLGRLAGLLRGGLASFVREREQRSPGAVYERAIAQRLVQYGELKDAVAGILYTRNKLEGEIVGRREELAHLAAMVKRALQRADDEDALAAIERRQALLAEVERAEQELVALRDEAEEAKGSLVRFREEIRALERERGRALALLASARARRRVHAVLEGLAVDADLRALESVREHVARTTLEPELAAEGELQIRLRRLRDEARSETARRELAELKSERAARLGASAGGAPAAGAEGARSEA